MSFTQDELQAFNTILEQRLSAHRRELERTFDRRISAVQLEFDQRLLNVQQQLLQQMMENWQKVQTEQQRGLEQQLEAQQTRLTHAIQREHEELQQQQQVQFEDVMERSLAAQLLAIEQLVRQYAPVASSEAAVELPIALLHEAQSGLEAIEVQTEIPWDELLDVFEKILDERMASFREMVQTSLGSVEQHLSSQIQQLREVLSRQSSHSLSGVSAMPDMHQVLAGITQLERIIESMHVSMTANHAFLSNRLYHHQHLPPEQAHSSSTSTSSQPTAPLPIQDLAEIEGEESAAFKGKPESNGLTHSGD